MFIKVKIDEKNNFHHSAAAEGGCSICFLKGMVQTTQNSFSKLLFLKKRIVRLDPSRIVKNKIWSRLKKKILEIDLQKPKIWPFFHFSYFTVFFLSVRKLKFLFLKRHFGYENGGIFTNAYIRGVFSHGESIAAIHFICIPAWFCMNDHPGIPKFEKSIKSRQKWLQI